MNFADFDTCLAIMIGSISPVFETSRVRIMVYQKFKSYQRKSRRMFLCSIMNETSGWMTFTFNRIMREKTESSTCPP